MLVASVDAAAKKITGSLDQEPEFQGAVLAVQNRTGRVLAMVGGRSFELSRFNRTTQAMRQLGSTFKPIVYATAIDRGFTPVSILQDSPASWSAGAGQPLYEPLNYDKKFEGPITLRHGLEQSRNVPTVRLMESLEPEHGRGLRRQARVHVEGPAVSLVGARLVRSDAAGSGQRVRRLPEPGRPGDAVRDRRASPIARATCSRRTARRRRRPCAPTPRS